MFKLILVTVALAASQAAAVLAPAYGYGLNPYSNYPAQPAITSQQSNILRSPFNLGQISTYSKSIDTPFSSVRKSDVRVSNPGVAIAAPAYHGYGAVGYAAPAYHGYASPAYHGYASPVVSHVGVAPVARQVAAPAALLGVAYSAAPAVSHMTYSNGLGLSYAW